ncbi:preprotein translocase subunit SecE [Chloroflexota bacterium]
MAKTESARKNRGNAVVEYFRETWFELKKVSWPTRQEALNLTLMVILVTAFLAVVLSLMDWAISEAFRLIL